MEISDDLVKPLPAKDGDPAPTLKLLGDDGNRPKDLPADEPEPYRLDLTGADFGVIYGALGLVRAQGDMLDYVAGLRSRIRPLVPAAPTPESPPLQA